MAEKDKGLIGNEQIEENIEALKTSFTDENLATVLTTIRKRILDRGQFVVAVEVPDGASNPGTNLALKTCNFNGKKWFIAFTSFDEELKGNNSVMSCFLADIDKIFDFTLNNTEVEGVILNPYGNMMTLNKQIIEVIIGQEK